MRYPHTASVLRLAHPRARRRTDRLLRSTNGSQGNRPGAAGKPASSRTEGIGDPFTICRSGSHCSKERRSKPEVDAGEVRPILPNPSFHRSWGKRRRRLRTNPESSQPPGPILKMCATAQPVHQFPSGPALAVQIEPSAILKKGEADDLGEAHKQEIQGPDWGREQAGGLWRLVG